MPASIASPAYWRSITNGILTMATISWFKGGLRSPAAGATLLLGASLFLVATGIVGVGRHDNETPDVAYLYAAGRSWKAGQSPYNPLALKAYDRGLTGIGDSGFGYPPHSSALMVFLALFSWSTAKALWLAIGLASVAVLACLCAAPFRSIPPPVGGAPLPGSGWLAACIVVAAPIASHGLWKGGTSVLAGALLVSAWTAIVKDRRILGGVLLGLATFKPQLALLPVIWLLLEREWKVLAIGSTTAMVMSVPAFIASGVSGSYVEWCSMLGIARDKAVFEGIWAETEWRRFFIAAGLPLPDLLLVAPAATLAVWMVRDRIVLDDRYPLILGIAFQFIYLHDGDLMAISPMASSYLRRLRGKASGWLAVALLLVLCTPQRLLRRSGVDALAHIRIPALALLWAWLLVMALQERRLNTPVDSPNALPPPA